MKYYLFTLCFLMLQAISSYGADVYWLFKDGHSDYDIVISNQASATEIKAANELQDYVRQIGNVVLPISRNPNAAGQHVYIGYNETVGRLTGASKPSDGDERFVWRQVGDDLCIYGGASHGTMYGVYAFLEQQMGVRWYAPDYTAVPHLKQFALKSMDHSEDPAFRYRHVFYYGAINNVAWDAHNGLNSGSSAANTAYGRQEWYWGIHTFSDLIKPSEYFGMHPEYFSLHNGKRIDNGQLCLSNPAVIALLKDKLLKVISDYPGGWVYSLSQNDNNLPCECSRCKAIEKKYGGHAGLILWVVNQVAETVEKAHPGVCVGTLAYQYSRHVPHGIVPRPNVVIRLCDIECCFAHPIASDQYNLDFLQDLKAWSQLTDRLFIWDYVAGFCQYLAPFPNFNVLSKNLQLFQQHHVIGVFEEGQYESSGGEFAELKQWLLAKLLWNPDQDVELLAKEFIQAYYGKAAAEVEQYYEMCNRLVNGNTHFTFSIDHHNALYSDAFVSQGRKLLDAAVKECGEDAVLRGRVDRLRLQVLYLHYQRNKAIAIADGTAKELFRILKQQKVFVREGKSADQFIHEEGFI